MQTNKDSRLNIRCNAHALDAAEKLVQANECITLQPDEFQAFLAALDAPASPNSALQQAMKRHAEQVLS